MKPKKLDVVLYLLRDTLLDRRPTFVAALARQPRLDIFGDMLVAKINLLDCSRKVRSLGYDFGVCKVDRQ